MVCLLLLTAATTGSQPAWSQCLWQDGRDKATTAIFSAPRTEVRRISRLNGPIRSLQTLDFAEVPVSGNEDHPMTFRRGGNPDVVFGKRPPLLLQALLQTSVFASDIEIA